MQTEFTSRDLRHGIYVMDSRRNGIQYETLVQFLSDNQLSLLKAIAKAEVVKSHQSSEFIQTNELPSPSSVKTALTLLENKDLVYHDARGYNIYDRFFSIWLKQCL